MTSRTVRAAVIAGLIPYSAALADGPVESISPFGLQTIGPTIQADAPVDAFHEAFEAFKPTIVNYLDAPMNQTTVGSATFFDPVSGEFGLGGDLTGTTMVEVLDDNEIIIPFDAYARMYFVRETGGFSNTLGYVENLGITGAPLESLDPIPTESIIFPLVEAETDIVADQDLVGGPGFFANYTDPEGAVLREATLASDFVNIGEVEEGTELDFFLIPDGADVSPDASLAITKPWWDVPNDREADAPIWWTDATLNIDANDGGSGPDHARVARFENNGFVYFLLAFEDVPFPQNFGEAVDFDDAVAVLQVGIQNIEVPEPGVYLLFGTMLMVVMHVKRKKEARRSRARQ